MNVTSAGGYLAMPPKWYKRLHIVRMFDELPVIGSQHRLKRAVNRVLADRAEEFQVEWRDLNSGRTRC